MFLKFSWTVLVFVLASLSSAWKPVKPFSVPSAAIYVLNNDPNGASIISAAVNRNGSLSSPTVTTTGGKGLAAIVGQGQPGVGSLFGANSVVVENNVSREMNSPSPCSQRSG
jgi:hypothetical protein